MSFDKVLKNIILIICFSGIFNLQVLATDVIKVACILDDGFYIQQENGNLVGYNYDYLMQVALHTGWEYEFVIIEDEDINEAYSKATYLLENGEVDLIGSAFKTEETEEIFEFPSMHSGITRYCLMSLANNYKITMNNYFLQDSLSIALVRDAEELNTMYKELLEMRDINFEITYADTFDEVMELLINEEVDTILASDSSQYSWMLTYLTTIERKPFYFVAQKGNIDLITQLDEAIYSINIEDPEITESLMIEYFAHNHNGDIILTTDEKLALAEYEYFNVGLIRNMQPYQTNENEDYGITIEILNCISEIIGKEFHYVFVDSVDELVEKMAKKEIDFIGTLPLDYKLAMSLDIILTKPYLTNGVVLLTRDNQQAENVLFHMVTDALLVYNEENIEMTFAIEEAILDLSHHGEYSIFCDLNIAKYHLNNLDVPNIRLQSINSMTTEICLGVGKHIDSTIVGLLSHATLHLKEAKIDEIVYENLVFAHEITLKEFIQKNFITFSIMLILFFMIIIVSLAASSRKFKELSRKDSLTKLYNAGYFHEYATEKTLKRKHGCLILIDIDYFKQVNDTHGHHKGDKIIILVSEKLKEICAVYGMVARLGGDEFVVLSKPKLKVQY